MQRMYLLLAIVTALLFTGSHAYLQSTISNDLMLCRSVPRIFGSLDQEDKDEDVVKQGNVGIPGVRGRKGLPGPRGEPDYDKVRSMVDGKAKELMAKLKRLEDELAYLRKNPPTFVSAVAGPTRSSEEIDYGFQCMNKFYAPLNSGRQCYALLGGPGLSLTYEYAQKNCSKLGGRMAAVDSKELYHQLYDYADKSHNTVVKAWTGLTFKDGKLFDNDGKEPNYKKWMAYYPKDGKSYTYYAKYTSVILYLDTSSMIRGLQNTPESRTYPFVVCEYSLDGAYTTTAPITEEPDDPDEYYDY